MQSVRPRRSRAPSQGPAEVVAGQVPVGKFLEGVSNFRILQESGLRYHPHDLSSPLQDSVRVKIMLNIIKTVICTFVPTPQSNFQGVAYMSLCGFRKPLVPHYLIYSTYLGPHSSSISHS